VDGWLHLFGTGIGLLILQLSIAAHPFGREQPTPSDLERALFRLAQDCLHPDNGERRTVAWQARSYHPNVTFSGTRQQEERRLGLKTLTEALLPALAREVRPVGVKVQSAFRPFAFTTVVFDNAKEKAEGTAGSMPKTVLRDACWHFSRPFAPEWEASPDDLERDALDLSGGCFMAAMEGGAVVAVSGTGSAEDLVTHSAPKCHVPLAMMAYQEWLALSDMAPEVRFPLDGGDPVAEDIERLNRFEIALLDFRLRFRFTHVSRLQRYNRVFACWRVAMNLDALLAEVDGDVVEAAAFLRGYRERREEERRAEVARVQTLLGLWYATLVLLAGIFGMNVGIFGKLLDAETVGGWMLHLLVFVAVVAVTVGSALYLQGWTEKSFRGETPVGLPQPLSWLSCHSGAPESVVAWVLRGRVAARTWWRHLIFFDNPPNR
jgi:hypothetical protein